MNNFSVGQIRVNERSKILDFDCIMETFFVERNNKILLDVKHHFYSLTL